MLLNTKQVRTLALNAFNVTASYTDKTQRKTNSKRRSVVFTIHNNPQLATALANYLRSNCTNKVTQTGGCAVFNGRMFAHYNGRMFGVEYVRVIADLA